MGVVLVVLFIFTFSCSDIFVEKDLLQRPNAQRCSDCHGEIFKEWEKSRHAMAWKSEEFKLQTENYTKSKCLSCHAPHQVDPEVKPVLAKKFLEDGIGCVACHFKDETKAMHGPHKVWSPPHPSKEDFAYVKSEFCAGCHQETHKEWKQAKMTFRVEKSCQDCHMPNMGAKRIVQKFPFEYFHSKKPRHDHSFPTGMAKAEDIKIDLQKGQNGYILTLVNIGVPHNLPTADQGEPKLYIVVESDQGRIVRVLSPQAKNALVYNEPMQIELPWQKVEKIKVDIMRKLSWKKERELIKSQTFVAN